MSQTKSRNGGRKNTNRKSTPDLMATLSKKRGPGRPPKHLPAPSASQIADSIEQHAHKLLKIADDLRS